MEAIMKQFRAAQSILNDKGIVIQTNDGSVCGELMFKTEDLIRYLNNSHRTNGLARLQDLSKLINQDGLGIVDYYGSAVNKWAMENEDLFQNLAEDHIGRICGFDCAVYVNNYGKGEKEHELRNKYVKECAEYTDEEIKLAEVHKDGMLWYWVGEY
jgi:hypothetical protein